MKKTTMLRMLAVVLVAVQALWTLAAGETTPQVRACGLLGPVSSAISQATANGNIESADTITFNEKGLVTRDLYNNLYTWGADGRFVRGIKDYSRVMCDMNGRVNTYIHYNENDDEDVEGFNYEFSYDDQGRTTRVMSTFWEWTVCYDYTYDGDQVAPARAEINFRDHENLTTFLYTYQYTDFDKTGNWTKRNVALRQVDMEFPDGGEGEPRVLNTLEQKLTETRVVTYY